jgi:malonyl-CoA/methylmalonyl-CoA synthetase
MTEAKAGGGAPILARAARHGERLALVDGEGKCTYERLLALASGVAGALLAGRVDLGEERVVFLTQPGIPWVAAQWGIWLAGGIAVPLPLGAPLPELEYLLDDTRATVAVVDESAEPVLAAALAARRVRLVRLREAMGASPAARLPEVGPGRRAMIIYTSGTTSRPKGVVTTHGNITAQITTLVDAWGWSGGDRTLLCLPLHHVHGIINVVSCALWAGATCEMLPRFDGETVWERLASGELTVFMAVPTIYTRLIALWEAAGPERRQAMSRGCGRLRLMVSGSAALPVSTLEKWRAISGHTLLERYGMTEIGMALSNPLRGERVPGSVGVPLPGVGVQLVDEAGAPVAEGAPGEIAVRGPSVFREYWGREEATRQAFRNGWFRTGDVAVVERGVYRILGRTSVDIIKTGGHKVSALEIEEILREHAAIGECAVVGVADAEWGERVAAAVVLRPGMSLELEELRGWAHQRLAVHKIPSRLLTLAALPRNAMGKVMKPAVSALFQPDEPVAK